MGLSGWGRGDRFWCQEGGAQVPAPLQTSRVFLIGRRCPSLPCPEAVSPKFIPQPLGTFYSVFLIPLGAKVLMGFQQVDGGCGTPPIPSHLSMVRLYSPPLMGMGLPHGAGVWDSAISCVLPVVVALFSQCYVLRFGLDWPNTKTFPKQCLGFLEFGDTMSLISGSQNTTADRSISIWLFVRGTSLGTLSQPPEWEALGAGSRSLLTSSPGDSDAHSHWSTSSWALWLPSVKAAGPLPLLLSLSLSPFTVSLPAYC